MQFDTPLPPDSRTSALRSVRVALLLIACPAVSFAAADSKDAATKEPIAILESFVVKDVPNELSIMPTSRAVDSLFGDGRSIMTTPRSVSAITKEMMEMRGIDRIENLGLLSPGVYSPSIYGVAGAPTIRGDFGEVMQNGQRRRFQRLSYSPNFGVVESLDIVKGSGSVSFGPATRGGGIVNLITRKPLFGKDQTEVKTQIGDFVMGEGDSYQNVSFSVDMNNAISDKLALRAIVGGREADSWYRNVFDKNRLVSVAFSARPAARIQNEFSASYETFKNNESLGINRMSQEFIDHGLYVAGPATALQTGTGNRAIVNAATATKIYLPGWKTITPTGSGGEAKRYNAQNIFTYAASAELKLRVYSMYEYLEARKFSPHSYQNYSPGNDLFDTRAEASYRYRLFGQEAHSLLGVAYRYDDAIGYTDGVDEVQNLYDLSADSSTYFNPGYPAFSVANGTSGYIPGMDQATYRSVISQAAKSTIRQLAPFLQQEVKLGNWVSVLGGLRFDRTSVTAQRPALLNASGAVIASTGDASRASAKVTNPTRSVSLILTPRPWVTLYYTYNYIENVQGNDFNAVSTIDGEPTIAGFQPRVNDQDLKVKNALREIGGKLSLFDNTVYVSGSAFKQDRTRVDPLTYIRSPFNVHGCEGEISYQPTVALSIYANASYTWGRQPNTRPNPGTKNYLDQFPVGLIVDGKSGTGLGSPNTTYNPYSVGNWRLPGLPATIVNLGSTYMFANGFGVTGNMQYIASYPLNYDNTLMVRDSAEFGLGFMYRLKQWSYRLSIMNLFDERIITPLGSGGGGNHIAFVEKPRRANVTIAYRF